MGNIKNHAYYKRLISHDTADGIMTISHKIEDLFYYIRKME